MGVQIEIAQALQDEEELNAFLLERERLVSLPRFFAEEQIVPFPLGKCEDIEQIMVRESDLLLVQEYVKPVVGKECFHLTPYVGLAMEWDRTRSSGGAGRVAGRYYYKPGHAVAPETVAAFKKIFSQLQSRIRRVYPKKSEGRFHTYVGPHLASAIQRKEMELVYPNGKIVPLIDN